jgi:dephospho-CoA kinase
MAVVALTGGIAAGKTTVTEELAATGIAVIDADQVARDVVAPGESVLGAIAEHFGPSVLTPGGALNREALAHIVFDDEAARSTLNSLVHPAVWERSTALFRAHEAAHPDIPLVYAVPLLAEGQRAKEFDLVVVVDAPDSVRRDRLVQYRQMSEETATARIKSQASDEARREIADVLLDAGGDVETTKEAARQLAKGLWEYWPDRLDDIAHVLPITGE